MNKVIAVILIFTNILWAIPDKTCDKCITEYEYVPIKRDIDNLTKKLVELKARLVEKDKNLETLRTAIHENNQNLHDNYDLFATEIEILGGILLLLSIGFGVWYNNRIKGAREVVNDFIKDAREHTFLTRQEGINAIKNLKEAQEEIIRSSNQLSEAQRTEYNQQKAFLLDIQRSMEDEKTNMKDFVDKYTYMKDDSENDLKSVIDEQIRIYLTANLCNDIEECKKDHDEW